MGGPTLTKEGDMKQKKVDWGRKQENKKLKN